MIVSLLALSFVLLPEVSTDYAGVVEGYRSGNREPALHAEWTAPDLKREVEAAKKRAGFPLEAAALLHAEREMARRTLRGQPATADLAAAQELVAAIADRGPRERFERRFLLLIALHLMHVMDWEACSSWLDASLARYPEDSRLLLARGSLLETLAQLDAAHIDFGEITLGDFGRRDALWAASTQMRGRLAEAEKCYRRALASEPGLAVARARLARVLEHSGKTDAALVEAQKVAAAEGAPVSARYLANLFLGSAADARQRWADSIAAYRAAAALVPDGQAAAVGLSYALEQSGKEDEARAALATGLARAGRRDENDPWWLYPWGQADEIEALVASLRAEIAR